MLTRYKGWKWLAGTVLWVFLLSWCASAQEAADDTEKEELGQILVLYPETADSLTGKDNLSGISEVLLALGYTADFQRIGMSEISLQGYNQVIVVNTERGDPVTFDFLADYSGKLLLLGAMPEETVLGAVMALPDRIIEEKIGVCNVSFYDNRIFQASVPVWSPGYMENAEETSGTLRMGNIELPVSSALGDVRTVNLVDYTTDFSKAVLLNEIAKWLWPYESRMHTYAQYVVLDEIYPFADPYRLKEVIEYMVGKKMHFVLSVMPVYEHTDYPAMQQFCKLLRYAQAHGGAVILHYPIVQNGLDVEELAEELTIAWQSYLSSQVFPLALEIPSEWLFANDLQMILGRYRTLFLRDLEAFSNHAVREYGMKSFLKLGSQRISPAFSLEDTRISHLGCYASAVYLPFSELTNEELFSSIDAAADSPLPMQSLWDMEEAVYLNQGAYMTWDRTSLIVDGEVRGLEYVPEEIPEDFDYQRNVYYRVVANISNQNHLLIGISMVVLALFLLLGIRSRKQMHRRFLEKNRSAGESRDGKTK